MVEVRFLLPLPSWERAGVRGRYGFTLRAMFRWILWTSGM
jgi:hypothetical protein